VQTQPEQPVTTVSQLLMIDQQLVMRFEDGDDHGGGGGEGSLWEALPSVAVVGGQVRSAHHLQIRRAQEPGPRSGQRANR